MRLANKQAVDWCDGGDVQLTETGLRWQQKLLKSWRCWSLCVRRHWCGSGRVISGSAVTQLLFVLGSIDSFRLVCGGFTGMLLKAFLRFLDALEAKRSYHKRWRLSRVCLSLIPTAYKRLHQTICLDDQNTSPSTNLILYLIVFNRVLGKKNGLKDFGFLNKKLDESLC